MAQAGAWHWGRSRLRTKMHRTLTASTPWWGVVFGGARSALRAVVFGGARSALRAVALRVGAGSTQAPSALACQLSYVNFR